MLFRVLRSSVPFGPEVTPIKFLDEILFCYSLFGEPSLSSKGDGDLDLKLWLKLLLFIFLLLPARLPFFIYDSL